MILLAELHFSLPLKNPVLIFSLILFIILFAPLLLNRVKIPQLIGLIIAGAMIELYVLQLMDRESSIIIFGTVGMIYLIFLPGLEIDLGDLKQNKNKSNAFGLLTFSLPLIIGTLARYYLLHF